jgi:hypothetical protein
MNAVALRAALLAAAWLATAAAAGAAERSFGDRRLLVAPSTGRFELPIGDDERIQDYACRESGSSMVTEENKRVEFEDKPAGTVAFVLEEPDEMHVTLRQMQVEGPMLMVWFDSRGWFPEYTAPALLTVRKEMYGAEPVSTLLATALLAGLPLLLTPGEVAKGTFGCTDRESTGKYVDVAARRKGRKGYWASHPREATITLEGFQTPRTLTVSVDGDTGLAQVDLTRLIKTTPFDGPTALKVTCSDCTVQTPKQAKEFGAAPTLLAATVDFRPVRDEFDRQARLQAEAESRARAEAQARAEGEAERLRLERLQAERLAEERRLEAEAARMEAERIEQARLREEARAEQARRAEAERIERERRRQRAKQDTLRNL